MTTTITPATVLQRGRGKGRDKWDIKRWMESRGLTAAKLARALDKHHNVVGETLSGLRNDKGVLQYLEAQGCPQKLLYPMGKEAA